MAGRIIGECRRATLNIRLRDELPVERNVQGRDRLGFWICNVEQVFGWEQEQSVGSRTDRKNALDLPVVSGDNYDIAGSGICDVDEVSVFIYGHPARRRHVQNMTDDTPFRGIEKIDRASAAVRDENHAVSEGYFIKPRSAGKIENGNLPQGRDGSSGKQQRRGEK